MADDRFGLVDLREVRKASIRITILTPGNQTLVYVGVNLSSEGLSEKVLNLQG